MITEKEDLRIIRLNPSNYSVEYLYDDFEKLVNNTRIRCVNKKLSAGTRSYRRMEFQIKKIPKWRRLTLQTWEKLWRENKYFHLFIAYVEKSKVLRYYSRMAQRINVPDNTRFNYLELFNNFVKLLLQSVYREHERGI